MNKPGKKGTRQDDPGQETMAGFEHTGAYLRKLRTEKGLSVGEACEATRISEINLRAMEEQDFAALPAETFTRGLLTIYARYLGAEPAHVVPRFMREREQSQAHGKRVRPRPGDHQILTPKKLAEPAHVSSLTMALILLLVIVALFTGFCLYTSWNPFSFLVEDSATTPAPVMHPLPAATTPAASPAPNAASTENVRLPEAAPPTAAPLPAAAGIAEPQPGATAPPETEPATTTPAETAPAEIAPPASAPPATKPAKAKPAAPGETSGLETLNREQPAAATTSAPAAGSERLTVEFLKDTRVILKRDNQEVVNGRFKKGEERSWPLAGSMQVSFDEPESAVVLANGRQLPFPGEENGRYTLLLPAE